MMMKMLMIMSKLQRFRRIRRQLHTIISQETIKPSSPTPSHLKTHNLSLLDQFLPNIHVPIVFFYKKYNNGDTSILKQSLSKSLTHYYPFAGRFPTPPAPYVNCNDEGIAFLEATNDNRIDDFVAKKEQDETLNQLFPHGLGCSIHKASNNLVEVQLNHFACGGVAVAVSLLHKVADGSTIANFINHWATVTRGVSPTNPSFITSSLCNTKMAEFELKPAKEVKYVARRFVFQNSKLNELKKKVNGMGIAPTNPTRVEVLTSLLFKCAVGAATKNSGSSKPSTLFQTVNLRHRLVKRYPKTAAGNIFTSVMAKMAETSEMKLNEVIVKLKKGRMELEGLRDVEEVGEKWLKTLSTLGGTDMDQSRAYYSSSICGFPFYEVDFGWGKPEQVMVQNADSDVNGIILMDSPCGDGIEVLVRLKEEEMAIFRKDKELLAYVEADI